MNKPSQGRQASQAPTSLRETDFSEVAVDWKDQEPSSHPGYGLDKLLVFWGCQSLLYLDCRLPVS